MDINFFNISLAFLEGFALIISPCILPILPIILAGSLTGNKRRPYGIITGFILIFCIATLFSRLLFQYAHLNPQYLRNISFVILILLGIMMMSTFLTEKFNLFAQGLTRVGSRYQTINDPESGFWGGILFGGLIAIIWTPCAGPILAAVIVQVLIQDTTLNSTLTVIAFAIGAGIPMLLIAMLGRKILERMNFFRHHTTLIRQILGFIIIVSVILSYYSPTLALSFSRPIRTDSEGTELIGELRNPYQAPEIGGIDAWLNSAPLTLASLRGKVVLIDFWTYSCINCIRTLPYLKNWYAKYHDKGFEIIGIHTPEFEFEKDINNVKNAIKEYGIQYPVALDNNFITWRNFSNQFWPSHYLINKEGLVVYQHFGEGEYDVMENNIIYLLGISGKITSEPEQTFSFMQTPETYLGYDRAENNASPEKVTKDLANIYSYPNALSKNQWALEGSWNINSDKIVSVSPNAKIQLHFYARKVYAVMGVRGTIIHVTINLKDENNKILSQTKLDVNENKLYTLVNFKDFQAGMVELIAEEPGLEMYTFTFG